MEKFDLPVFLTCFYLCHIAVNFLELSYFCKIYYIYLNKMREKFKKKLFYE